MSITYTKSKNILVVCTGNLCRSPIAAAFIQNTLSQDNLLEHISVSSAGLNVEQNHPSPSKVIEELKLKYNIDISDHRSQSLTTDLFQKASLVMVMEQAQLMRLSSQYPRHSFKIRLMSELSDQIFDIEDPLTNSTVNLAHISEQLHNLVKQNLLTLLSWLKLEK